MRQSLQQKSHNLNGESRKVLSGEVALKLTPAAQARCSQPVDGSARSKGGHTCAGDTPGLRGRLGKPTRAERRARRPSTEGHGSHRPCYTEKHTPATRFLLQPGQGQRVTSDLCHSSLPHGPSPADWTLLRDNSRLPSSRRPRRACQHW